jgi:hypothetical protein
MKSRRNEEFKRMRWEQNWLKTSRNSRRKKIRKWIMIMSWEWTRSMIWKKNWRRARESQSTKVGVELSQEVKANNNKWNRRGVVWMIVEKKKKKIIMERRDRWSGTFWDWGWW